MAALPVERRIALSYGKSEFIRMCSFNGQQCDIIQDFKLHVDSAFGNCYTFNANRLKPLFSNRAGPSHGNFLWKILGFIGFKHMHYKFFF